MARVIFECDGYKVTVYRDEATLQDDEGTTLVSLPVELVAYWPEPDRLGEVLVHVYETAIQAGVRIGRSQKVDELYRLFEV